MSAASRVDASHDPALRSWVQSASRPGTDFPVQNLPLGRFRRTGRDEPWRCGVAIGDQVLDLRLALEQSPWNPAQQRLLEPLAAGDMNAFLTQGAPARRALRTLLSNALAAGSEFAPFLELGLVPQAHVEMSLPCRIGDYTDFFTGIHHATATGRLFRPDSPLLPNYKWVPIGYHGRASSIVVSGRDVVRPAGQRKGEGDVPLFGPSRRLDYELELGAIVGSGNALGRPVPIGEAADRLFGVVLLNDWSARDVQGWEYQPLGPFLGKSFATTISPWVVTMEALAPFRMPLQRPDGDPPPLAYLDDADDRAHGAFDIRLEVWLRTQAMRERGDRPVRLSASSFKDAYWTLAQMLAHHASNGCNLVEGDLLGTGTQSGAGAAEAGSLLELSDGGKKDVVLPGGETRRFLEDGDTVTFRAWCEREGAARIGFGLCSGRVVAAPAPEAPAA